MPINKDNLLKVYILILNWNGWKDNIECLESVFRNAYSHYTVVVCDNGSQDASLEYIKLWANGLVDVLVPSGNPLNHQSHPPVTKPIRYVEYNLEEAEKGGTDDKDASLVLIQNGVDWGFAAGNNVGLRYILARGDAEYVWLLNNDTVIANDSLVHLVERAMSYKENKQKIGIIGSKLFYYDKPHILQGVGGKYYKLVAASKHIGGFEEDRGQYDVPDIKMDYVIGASMLVDKQFLTDVGLMSPEYFLYFEEIDWGMRAKQKGWGLGYACKSIVFHKEGGCIGSSSTGVGKSKISDYYSLRNRIVFTKKFFPNYLWSIYLGFLISIWRRIKRKEFDRIYLIWNILFKFNKLIDNEFDKEQF